METRNPIPPLLFLASTNLGEGSFLRDPKNVWLYFSGAPTFFPPAPLREEDASTVTLLVLPSAILAELLVQCLRKHEKAAYQEQFRGVSL